jgi:hypothetical protein
MTSMPEYDGMASHGEGYFAVLPDCEATFAVASLLHGPEVRTLTHASGRPWLIGRWGNGGYSTRCDRMLSGQPCLVDP